MFSLLLKDLISDFYLSILYFNKTSEALLLLLVYEHEPVRTFALPMKNGMTGQKPPNWITDEHLSSLKNQNKNDIHIALA